MRRERQKADYQRGEEIFEILGSGQHQIIPKSSLG
jgi:hypothetical protein